MRGLGCVTTFGFTEPSLHVLQAKYLQTTEGAPQKCAGSVAWPKLSSSPRAPCCIAFSVSQCSMPATVPAFMNEIKN